MRNLGSRSRAGGAGGACNTDGADAQSPHTKSQASWGLSPALTGPPPKSCVGSRQPAQVGDNLYGDRWRLLTPHPAPSRPSTSMADGGGGAAPARNRDLLLSRLLRRQQWPPPPTHRSSARTLRFEVELGDASGSRSCDGPLAPVHRTRVLLRPWGSPLPGSCSGTSNLILDGQAGSEGLGRRWSGWLEVACLLSQIQATSRRRVRVRGRQRRTAFRSCP